MEYSFALKITSIAGSYGLYIDCRVLWTDEDFEMVAVKVKGRNPKFTWEVVGIYRAPNEDM